MRLFIGRMIREYFVLAGMLNRASKLNPCTLLPDDFIAFTR